MENRMFDYFKGWSEKRLAELQKQVLSDYTAQRMNVALNNLGATRDWLSGFAANCTADQCEKLNYRVIQPLTEEIRRIRTLLNERIGLDEYGDPLDATSGEAGA